MKVLRRRPGGARPPGAPDAGPPAPPGAGPGGPGAGPGVPGVDPTAERGRGRRRLALLVPAAMVALGLVAGALPVGRLVATGRPEPAARPAGGPAAQAEDPMAQLRDAGVVLFTDQQGRAFRQTADGRDRQALGQLKELAAQPSQPTFDPGDVAAGLLAAPADHRHAELAPDGDLAYLRQADGAAAVGRLRDGSVRRLVPAGWRSPTLPHHSADGAVVGACGYRLGGPGGNLPGVQAARSWILDGAGRELAALPGCLYDVADDGSAALVADPAQGRAAGPVPDAGFQELPVMEGSDQLTRGLRLWRRDDGFRPVLSFAEVVRTFQAVQPGADRRGLVVVTATLGPDLRQALVRIVDVLATQDPRTGREGELLALVDLERGRAEPVPEHLPGLMTWLPTGGFAYSGNAGLATYVARRQPPALLAATLAQEGTNVLAPSPDGAWLLLAGSTWRFVRVDDPAVQVAYRAPGRFAGWAPPAEPAAREGGP